MLKKFFMLCVIATTASMAHGYEKIKVWPAGMPNDNQYVVSEADSLNMNITNEPVIHLFPAENSVGKVVLICPGGGYSLLATEHEGTDYAPWFNRQGVDVAVLQYRMPNGHSDVPLSDAQQALRILRQRYPDSKVGIMGFSAGGHLASTAATHFVDDVTRPDFQILFYPVIEMSGKNSHPWSREKLLGKDATPEQIAVFDNQLHVTPQTPPAFILHSTDDTTVPVANSINYYTALVENKVPASLHIYPIGEHGWGFRDNYLYKPMWAAELEYWLLKSI